MNSLRYHGLKLLLEKHTLDEVYSLVTDNKETIDNTYREVQRAKTTRTLSDILHKMLVERNDAKSLNLYEIDRPGIVDLAVQQLTKTNPDFTIEELKHWLYCQSKGIPYESPTEHKLHSE